MNRKRARDLGKSLIVDLDGALASVNRPIEERHSAAASALITAARLLGGMAVNHARIADALDYIADQMAPDEEEKADGASTPD